MSNITYEDYVEAAEMGGFEIELSEEEFSELSEKQLNEISKALTGRYIKKASDDISYQTLDAHDPKNSDEKRDEAGDKRHFRRKSLNTAVNKLTGQAKVRATEETEMTEKNIDEGTAAADSLKPNSKPVSDPQSRVEIMKSMIGAMAEMPKRDLVKWFDQTQAQFGPNKDYGVSDNSGKNKSSIDMKASAAGSKGADVKMPMPKLSVKEDVDAMFEGQDLSEEFKEKASTIFEAAVSARIIAETARLEEEYEDTLNETVETFVEDLTNKVDVYLDHVVESWMKDNEVAVETSLRNEIVDDFIESLKGVFAEHYIDVPQEKLDVLEALSQKVDDLEARLDETISENAELKKIATGVEKNDVFDSVSEGLALSQVERFRDLAEGIEFEGDLSAYERKLNIIRETYFTDKKVPSTVLNEEVDGNSSLTEEVNFSPEMKKWAQAISRTVKK